MGDETKNILKSKTFWGVIIMAISSLLHFFNKDLSPDMQSELVNWLAGVGDLVGGALAIYGRVKADTSLTILPKKP